jgi:NAD-dependent SIR2 family protein deacetylase
MGNLAKESIWGLILKGSPGCTLLVHPAAQIPVIAKRAGAFLAIINLSETPCDGLCDVRISGPAGEVTPAIVDRIPVRSGRHSQQDR